MYIIYIVRAKRIGETTDACDCIGLRGVICMNVRNRVFRKVVSADKTGDAVDFPDLLKYARARVVLFCTPDNGN